MQEPEETKALHPFGELDALDDQFCHKSLRVL